MDILGLHHHFNEALGIGFVDWLGKYDVAAVRTDQPTCHHTTATGLELFRFTGGSSGDDGYLPIW